MDWKRGLKSGAVAGIIYGVPAGGISALYMVLFKEKVIAMIQAAISGQGIPISAEQLYNISLFSSFITSIFVGLIAGMVFGAVFTFMREELMGRNERMQGLFLSILLFACFGIAEIFFPENAIGAFMLLRLSHILLIPLSFGAFLLLGYLTGMFWVRFGHHEHHARQGQHGKK